MWITIIFIIQGYLRFFLWISIILEKENLETYLQGLGLQKKWHPQILENLPNIQLTLLIGQYAQKFYLSDNKNNVTETVKNYQKFLPHFIPLVHPSPRNQFWIERNPWFGEKVIPDLQKLVKRIINESKG